MNGIPSLGEQLKRKYSSYKNGFIKPLIVEKSKQSTSSNVF
jgi:hypothetical protein